MRMESTQSFNTVVCMRVSSLCLSVHLSVLSLSWKKNICGGFDQSPLDRFLCKCHFIMRLLLLKFNPARFTLKLAAATRSHYITLTLGVELCLKCRCTKLVLAMEYFKGVVSHLFLGNPTSEFLGMLQVCMWSAHAWPLLKRGQLPDCKWCQNAFNWPQSWNGDSWRVCYWFSLPNILPLNLLLIRLSECF